MICLELDSHQNILLLIYLARMSSFLYWLTVAQRIFANALYTEAAKLFLCYLPMMSTVIIVAICSNDKTDYCCYIACNTKHDQNQSTKPV